VHTTAGRTRPSKRERGEPTVDYSLRPGKVANVATEACPRKDAIIDLLRLRATG
jgi:hypothetical protein